MIPNTFDTLLFVPGTPQVRRNFFLDEPYPVKGFVSVMPTSLAWRDRDRQRDGLGRQAATGAGDSEGHTWGKWLDNMENETQSMQTGRGGRRCPDSPKSILFTAMIKIDLQLTSYLTTSNLLTTYKRIRCSKLFLSYCQKRRNHILTHTWVACAHCAAG
jgi:hypothetical protein